MFVPACRAVSAATASRSLAWRRWPAPAPLRAGWHDAATMATAVGTSENTVSGGLARADAAAIVAALAPHFAASRLARLQAVLACRVADTALVYENITDDHNVSACLRTADAMGIHTIHIIESYNTPFLSKTSVDKGSAKWLDVRRHRDVPAAAAALRADGFRIIATDLGPGALPLPAAIAASLAPSSSPSSAPPSLPTTPTRPRVALVFGNEHRGCSRAMLAAADIRTFMPQLGFVQSMNLSVASALVAAAFLARTPDYSDWAVAAAAACGAVVEGTSAAATAALSSTALLSAPPLVPAPPPVPAGGMGLERLSPDDRTRWLARWMMTSLASSRAILARKGLLPDDF